MATASKSGGRTPRGQGDLLRERLIEAALDLLDEGHEPADVSIRGVTRQAGVSPTAFYLHFDGRDELMRTLLERGFTDFRRWIRSGAERGLDPQHRLKSASAAYIDFSREQPGRYRLIFAVDPIADGILEEAGGMPVVASAAFDDLVGLIADYAGGGLPSESAKTLAVGFWSGLHGYATLCQTQPQIAAMDDGQYVDLLANAWLGPHSG
ncbi:MAG: TetR/AcrR family transcriptional regulator [Actinomycetes bacterium]